MNKTVLITGASSEFGRTTTMLFAKQGWNVVATMRRPGTASDLSAADGVLVARLDVQDPVSIDDVIAAGIAKFGRIDVPVTRSHGVVEGAGHNLPEEAPSKFADAVCELASARK